MKLPKVNPVVTSVFAIAFIFGFSVDADAQTKTYTLQEVLDSAKANYPTIKAAQFNIEKQKALKTAVWDFGITNIYTGKEETNNVSPGIHNRIGIEQSNIDLFAIPAKSKLANAQTNQAIQQEKLTLLEVEKEVKQAWYQAVYAKKELLMFEFLDSLYSDFLKASELKYKTGESSKIEFLTASGKFNELQIEKQQAKTLYYSALQELNKFILSPVAFDIDENSKETVFLVKSDSINTAPLLDYYESKTEIAKAQWKSEKANLLPKLNLEYKNQAIDGKSGFYAWQVGFSVPLVFFSQSAKNKAVKLDYKIANAELEQNKLMLNSRYLQLINRYKLMQQTIEYYQKTALPLANEQIKASKVAYKLGNIDYIKYIQSLETAVKIKRTYLEKQNELKNLQAEIEYLTGE